MEKFNLKVGCKVKLKNGMTGIIENINEFRPPEGKYAVSVPELNTNDLAFIGDADIQSFEVGGIVDDQELFPKDLNELFPKVEEKKEELPPLIEISLEEYKELLEIKGRYEELKKFHEPITIDCNLKEQPREIIDRDPFMGKPIYK